MNDVACFYQSHTPPSPLAECFVISLTSHMTRTTSHTHPAKYCVIHESSRSFATPPRLFEHVTVFVQGPLCALLAPAEKCPRNQYQPVLENSSYPMVAKASMGVRRVTCEICLQRT